MGTSCTVSLAAGRGSKVYDSEGKLAQRIVAEREGDVIFVTADAKHLPFTCEATNGCKVIVK